MHVTNRSQFFILPYLIILFKGGWGVTKVSLSEWHLRGRGIAKKSKKEQKTSQSHYCIYLLIAAIHLYPISIVLVLLSLIFCLQIIFNFFRNDFSEGLHVFRHSPVSVYFILVSLYLQKLRLFFRLYILDQFLHSPDAQFLEFYSHTLLLCCCIIVLRL